EVALGVGEVGPQRAVRLAHERHEEGGAVLEGSDCAAPAVLAVSLERYRRRKAAGLDPVAAAKRALAVGQLECKGLAVSTRGDGEAGDIGTPSVARAGNDERAADVGAETDRGAPEGLQIRRRLW